MRYLVSYDITDDGARYRMAEALKDHGRRVQHSVFECELSDDERTALAVRLSALVTGEADSCRFYPLCARCEAGLVVLGREVADPAGQAYIIV